MFKKRVQKQIDEQDHIDRVGENIKELEEMELRDTLSKTIISPFYSYLKDRLPLKQK